MAVKDNIDVAGLPTGAGLGRPGPVAAQDALVVGRLRAAGVTLLGKTRMDELALGASGANAHHGRTQNPRCPGHSPGGSSGGSAAAVAAGYCDAALGTDTLGSVRIPAAYCGLIGLKPTRGLLPMQGIVPLSWSLDHPGLIASSASTAARLLAALVGPGPGPGSGPEAADGLLRVGVPDVLDAMTLDPATRTLFDRALDRMTERGWSVARCRVADWQPIAIRRAGLLLAEAEGAEAHAALLDDDPALSPSIGALLRYGRDCGTGRLVRALRTLREAADGLRQALREHDVLALPTVPAPAYAWTDGPPADQADLVAPANFGGHPAISVPIGTAPDGRPIGLQLIGACGTDWRLLRAAQAIELLH
ncbi:MAG: amidase [Acetobacteraceae bacterium]